MGVNTADAETLESTGIDGEGPCGVLGNEPPPEFLKMLRDEEARRRRPSHIDNWCKAIVCAADAHLAIQTCRHTRDIGHDDPRYRGSNQGDGS